MGSRHPTHSSRTRAPTFEDDAPPAPEGQTAQSGVIQWPDAAGRAPLRVTRTLEDRDGPGTAKAAFTLDLSGRDPLAALEGAYVIGAQTDGTGARAFVGIDLSTDGDDAPEIVARASSRAGADGLAAGSLRLSIDGSGGGEAYTAPAALELVVTVSRSAPDLFE